MPRSTILLPKPFCIYCGKVVIKAPKGEHIVPEAIKGKLTITQVSGTKKVCSSCNNGVLSELDNELCRQSYLALVAAQESAEEFGQTWDVDYWSNNLLIEAKPDFEKKSMVHHPQMIFDGKRLELRGDYESMLRYGRDRFVAEFVRHMLSAFRDFKANKKKRRLHFKKVPVNPQFHAQYRYPPRVFTNRSIDEFVPGMSFQVRYLETSHKNEVLSRLENWDAGTRFNDEGVRMGAELGTVRLTFDTRLILRGLLKIAVNLLAAYCLRTPIDRDHCRDAILTVTGERAVHPQLMKRMGFVHADDVQLIRVPAAHSFLIQYSGRQWDVLCSFFGGRIGAFVFVPGPNNEDWNRAEIVMPIQGGSTFSTDKIIRPGRVNIVWDDIAEIAPSIEMINPTTVICTEVSSA